MRSKTFLTGTLFLFLVFFLSISSSHGEEGSLTLIYTSNTLGEVESCGCPEGGDAGGLARRSYYINTVKKGGQKPSYPRWRRCIGAQFF